MDELNKYSDEEFEQIMRELEKPPNSLNEYDYCDVISERLKNNPPIPEDVLFLHDAVFMDGEHVPDVELNDPNLIAPKKIVPYGEWNK